MKAAIKQSIMAAYNWGFLPGSAVSFLIHSLGLEAA
jgi:hypothetical protein